jgi:hypothetical protein
MICAAAALFLGISRGRDRHSVAMLRTGPFFFDSGKPGNWAISAFSIRRRRSVKKWAYKLPSIATRPGTGRGGLQLAPMTMGFHAACCWLMVRRL